jgi:cholesterol oxidase
MTVQSLAPEMRRTSARRPLRAPDPERHDVAARDGVSIRLTRHRAGDRGPVVLAHGLGVSSGIFTLDTVGTNLLEYLCAHGFDVWLLDYRVSIDLESSGRAWSADDVATMDFPAAIAAVRRVTGADRVDVVAHCYGATTFTMAMLAGLEGVRSAICSQIAAHVHAPAATRLKAGLALPQLLRAAGVGALTARTDEDDAWARAFDGALRLYPMPAAERCTSAACHRITFMYGRLYEHAQLNEATHDALPELFGRAAMVALEHLARMVRRGHVVTAAGRDDYLPRVERMAIPITFIHGARNACYLPASTAATVDALGAANGPELYERHVVPDYGHIDCIIGKDASTHVYPLMLRHFDRIAT